MKNANNILINRNKNVGASSDGQHQDTYPAALLGRRWQRSLQCPHTQEHTCGSEASSLSWAPGLYRAKAPTPPEEALG